MGGIFGNMSEMYKSLTDFLPMLKEHKIVRAERFCDGASLGFFNGNGYEI